VTRDRFGVAAVAALARRASAMAPHADIAASSACRRSPPLTARYAPLIIRSDSSPHIPSATVITCTKHAAANTSSSIHASVRRLRGRTSNHSASASTAIFISNCGNPAYGNGKGGVAGFAATTTAQAVHAAATASMISACRARRRTNAPGRKNAADTSSVDSHGTNCSSLASASHASGAVSKSATAHTGSRDDRPTRRSPCRAGAPVGDRVSPPTSC
jgi:hypothetical protein